MRDGLHRGTRRMMMSYVAFSGIAAAVVAVAGCEGGCRKSPAPSQQDPPKPAIASDDPATATTAKPEPSKPPMPSGDAGTPAAPAPSAAAPPSSSSPPAGSAAAVADPKPMLPKEDPQVDRVYRDLLKLWDGVSVFSADVETAMEQALDGPGTTKGLGHYDYQKQPGANPRIRYYMKNGIAFMMKDEHYIAPEFVMWIADGEFLFQQTRQPEVHRIDKRRYDPSLVLQIGGRDLLERLREENVLMLREEKQVDGRDAYVIDAIAKDGGNRSVHTFDKATGARLSWEEFGADPKPVFSVRLYNLSLTPEFPSDNFTFLIPDGVTLYDETK